MRMTGRSFVHTHLGIRLKALREMAGLSPYDVGRSDKIGSRSALQRLEAGVTQDVLMPVVDHLCKFYNADRALRYELRRMANACNDSTSDTWFEPVGLPTWAGLLLELEPKATRICSHEYELVPGLLQTEETIRALLAANTQLTSEQVEQLVARRLARQSKVLDHTATPTIDVTMSEAVMRRTVGGPKVHSGQIKHLKELAQQPNISIRILPFKAGTTPGPGHPFWILDLPKGFAKPVVYSESGLGSTYSDAPELVAARRDIFARIKDLSVSIGEFD